MLIEAGEDVSRGLLGGQFHLEKSKKKIILIILHVNTYS